MLKKIIVIAVCFFCVGNFLLAQNKVSSANNKVKVIDTSFFLPQLNRHRRIWIYLPASYTTSREKYPVIYMHDGQNVFDNKTAFASEWGVDEAMDTLTTLVKESIIVAIDNGEEKRMNEYSPYEMDKYGKGEGDQYVDFLVKTLRPYINNNYRTKKGSKYTFTAGSSMGGLISLYALLKYPKIFGGAGVFSPAFWIAPKLKMDIIKRAKKVKGKIYLYAGKQEDEAMVPGLLGVFNLLHQYSKSKLSMVIRSEGTHNEVSWRQEFPLFYKWLMH